MVYSVWNIATNIASFSLSPLYCPPLRQGTLLDEEDVERMYRFGLFTGGTGTICKIKKRTSLQGT